MIDVQNLTKRYGSFTALKSISFQAAEGEILGFLGPNGAGKTTTMRILTGYMPPTAGTAKVAGFDVFEQSLDVRARVGYLPETVPLYPDMTVRGYVKYIAELRSVVRPDARVDAVLEQVGMTSRRDSLIRAISKGMRQRVGLAQALVHDPPVLILDEPTIGLDPLQTQEVREMVRALGKTHTVMFSTHILSEAEQVCDRVIIIDKGQIVAMDTPQALRDQLQQGGRLYVRIGKRAAEDALRLIRAVAGVVEASPLHDGYVVQVRGGIDIRGRLSAALVNAGCELLELRPLAMSLEEIFMELTSQDASPTAPPPKTQRSQERKKRRA